MPLCSHSNTKRIIILSLLSFLFVFPTFAQTADSALYSMLQWRMIGPHRGGRTVGATGVAQQPNVFYIGVNNGGVWKTTDYGRTWNPIFDDQPTGSIGDVTVAPSNPNVVYAVSGEGLQRPDLSVGNGVYKSVNGGKTWTNTGLADAQQIGGVAIDPNNENIVYVAALGHPYGANAERGVYRTMDGGQHWKKVLFLDENTGAIQVTIDPQHPKTLYADMWAGRLAPWENGMWQGPESGLYKSTDGGDHWQKLNKGLPTAANGLGRIGFCIAPANPSRMYACVDATTGGGFYRSDDGGKTWALACADNRLWERGTDFAECKVDPKNPDIVYIANVVTWKSTDGGKTFQAWKGAPGGDDYHRLWINPDNTDVILLAGDQGAIITVNGGDTWSSWYNQPTAQFYHVSTDNAFPYNVYSGQQESGSVGIASRGNDGQITFREWHPVGAEEYGYIAPDPLNPDIIYGGKISRYNKRTGQTQNIAPEATRSGKYRFIRTAPVLFSPVDNKTLYYAGNILFKTTNGGQSWDIISPDLTREEYDVPECIGVYRDEKMKTMQRRGVIYTVAPGHKSLSTIWAGTDDGLIHLTHNGGKTWKNVTPPELTSWSKISLMDAGHSDDHTAYAAVNRIRLDDMQPCIYRTHNDGKTWQKITRGLPDDPINVVREDPKCPGLLFAGSERAVYVSFDDGNNWQPLRLNMPCSSIRDLVIKENDLVIATHGRSFWIMDNIAALRDIARLKDRDQAILFTTNTTWRVRWNVNTDTPLPREEPAGQNPPDGATIDYYLNKDAAGQVTIEILDATGRLVRKFASTDEPYKIPEVNIPLYWVRPQQQLSAAQGAHRFVWDLHYTPIDVAPSYAIGAIYGQTAPNYSSPWVMPGFYTVKLTVDGKTLTKPLEIKMDPRVKTPAAELNRTFKLSMQCYHDVVAIDTILLQLKTTGEKLAALQHNTTYMNTRLQTLITGTEQFSKAPADRDHDNFETVKGKLLGLMGLMQESEMPVATQAEKSVANAHSTFLALQKQWQEWQIRVEKEL